MEVTDTLVDGLCSEMVTLSVGVARKPFFVHKSVLTSQSKWFREIIEEMPNSGHGITIPLHSEEPGTIRLLIAFLYHGTLPEKDSGPFALAGESTKHCGWAVSTTPIPISTGTRHIEYETSMEVETSTSTDILNNICCMSQYRNFSPDELRLADYQELAGTKPSVSGTSFDQSHGCATSDKAGSVAIKTEESTSTYSTASSQLAIGASSSSQVLPSACVGAVTAPQSLLGPTSQTSSSVNIFGQVILKKKPVTLGNSRSISATFPKPTRLHKNTPSNLVSTTSIPLTHAANFASSPLEDHHLALLKLCLFAEQANWSSLFNTALRAYFHHNEKRNSPAFKVAHIKLTYTKSKSDSPLRELMMDIIQNTHGDKGYEDMIPFAQTNEEFLRDLLAIKLGTWKTKNPIRGAVSEGFYDMK